MLCPPERWFEAARSYLKSFAAFSGRESSTTSQPILPLSGRDWHHRFRSAPAGSASSSDSHAICATEDVRHEVPPAVFGRDRRPRPTPYILTEKPIQQVVIAASRSRYRPCGPTLQHPVLLAVLHGITRVRSDPPATGRHHARWTTDPMHQFVEPPCALA